MTGRAAQGMERCGAPPTRRIPRGPDLTPSFSPGRATVFLLLCVAVLAILFAAPCAPARATVIERTGADWTLAAPAGDAIPAGGTAPATPTAPGEAAGPAGPAGAEATDPRTPHPVSPWRALHPSQGSHPTQGPRPSQGSHPALPSHGSPGPHPSHGIFVPDPEAQP